MDLVLGDSPPVPADDHEFLEAEEGALRELARAPLEPLCKMMCLSLLLRIFKLLLGLILCKMIYLSLSLRIFRLPLSLGRCKLIFLSLTL